MADFRSFALVLQAAFGAAFAVCFAALTFLDGTGLITLYTGGVWVLGACSHDAALITATLTRGFTATRCQEAKHGIV